MQTLKINKVGNSLGVILPKEFLAKMKLGKGDNSLLQSVLSKQQNLHVYGEPDLAEFAVWIRNNSKTK